MAWNSLPLGKKETTRDKYGKILIQFMSKEWFHNAF